MKTVGIGLLGFGTVGTGVVMGLHKNQGLLENRTGLKLELRRIADIDVESDRGVSVPPGVLTRDAEAVVASPDVDIVIELIGGLNAARSLITQALQRGKPVVTANKALLAEHGAELFKLAEANRTDIFFEASVGGGIPLIRSLREGLVSNHIQSIYGILNGTCNYILTRMEQNRMSFATALKEAQKAGFAEADPALGRTFFGLPEGAFLFLTLYDVRSYVERKNPYGAIDAFEKAFGTQHTDVLLVVKALNAGPGEMARLRRRIGSACNIRVLSATLEKRAVHSLIRACDALVSLHRSEGFGLVLAEAMSLGVPVIATGWSANTDFMDGGNSCPVSYHLVDTGGAYVPMRQRQQWADPDLADAAAQMRRLVLEPSFRRRIAQAGQDTIRLRFSVDASAAKMSARLHELGLLP